MTNPYSAGARLPTTLYSLTPSTPSVVPIIEDAFMLMMLV